MQSREILGFRDPQARLRDIILMQGYEDMSDQPLLDRVDSYTREVAFEVLNIVEIRLEAVRTISQVELSDFILSDDWVESVVESPRVLH